MQIVRALLRLQNGHFYRPPPRSAFPHANTGASYVLGGVGKSKFPVLHVPVRSMFFLFCSECWR